MSDTSDNAWSRTLKAQKAVLTRKAKAKAQQKPWRSYSKQSPYYTIFALHRQQGGKCANLECQAIVPVLGRARALDHDSSNGAPLSILCKSCSMALANIHRKRNRLQGLIDYLDRIYAAGLAKKRLEKSVERSLARDRAEKSIL